MSNALIIRDEALMPATFEGMLHQADVLVKSGLLPDTIKTPAAAVAIMLTGRELGIPPMQAFRSVYVVKGKPTLSAQLMGALIRRDGHSYHVDELNDRRCVITFQRRGGRPYTHTFTIEEAERAGLAATATWKAYTKAMLFSRCMSAGARIEMPDVIAGMYTPDELTDGAVGYDLNGDVINAPAAPETPPPPQDEPPAAQPEDAHDNHSALRPYPPEVVRNKLIATRGVYPQDDKNDAPSPAQLGLMNGKLTEAGGGDDQFRKLFLEYVWGVDTSKLLDRAQVQATLKWLLNPGDERTINPDAAKELALIARERLLAQGQKELPLGV